MKGFDDRKELPPSEPKLLRIGFIHATRATRRKILSPLSVKLLDRALRHHHDRLILLGLHLNWLLSHHWLVHGRRLCTNHHLLLLRHGLLHDHLLLWHVAGALHWHLLGPLALQLVVLVHSCLRVGLLSVGILPVGQHQALGRNLSVRAVLHQLRLLLSSSEHEMLFCSVSLF